MPGSGERTGHACFPGMLTGAFYQLLSSGTSSDLGGGISVDQYIGTQLQKGGLQGARQPQSGDLRGEHRSPLLVGRRSGRPAQPRSEQRLQSLLQGLAPDDVTTGTGGAGGRSGAAARAARRSTTRTPSSKSILDSVDRGPQSVLEHRRQRGQAEHRPAPDLDPRHRECGCRMTHDDAAHRGRRRRAHLHDDR